MSAMRLGFRLFAMILLVLAVMQVLGARPADANTEKESGNVNASSAGSVAEELEKRRKELDEKERLLKEREEQLAAQSAEVEKRILRIEEIRAQVNGEVAKKKSQSEERVVRMVSVFETMSPKSAAQIMETLDDDLSVEVLGRMDPKRVAKLMNVMDKARSARLSERLTGYIKLPTSEQQVASQSKATLPSQNPAGQTNAAVKSSDRAPASVAGTAVKSDKGGNK